MPAKAPKTDKPTEPGQASLTAIGNPVALGATAAQAWMDMGTEAVRFVWDRMQQDLKTQQAMLACTSLEEMQRIQAEFFAAAREQYTAEVAKMLEMIGKATAPGFAAHPGARRYDDIPL
jgi:hypothetical protein